MNWLITNPEWVVASAKAGKWLDESAYGFKAMENPYLGKSFFLHPSITKDQADFLKELVICSKGAIVDAEHDADHIITGSEAEETGPKHMWWNRYLSKIPAPIE